MHETMMIDRTDRAKTRDAGLLARFFAAILFGFSLVFFLLSLLFLASLLGEGKAMGPWWTLPILGAATWALGWMASLIWSGRNFPPTLWLTFSMGMASLAVAVATVPLIEGDFAGLLSRLPVVFGLAGMGRTFHSVARHTRPSASMEGC